MTVLVENEILGCTCSWRSHKQDTSWRPGAKVQKALRIPQELHKLNDLLLDLIYASDIVESDGHILASDLVKADSTKQPESNWVDDQ